MATNNVPRISRDDWIQHFNAVPLFGGKEELEKTIFRKFYMKAPYRLWFD